MKTNKPCETSMTRLKTFPFLCANSQGFLYLTAVNKRGGKVVLKFKKYEEGFEWKLIDFKFLKNTWWFYLGNLMPSNVDCDCGNGVEVDSIIFLGLSYCGKKYGYSDKLLHNWRVMIHILGHDFEIKSVEK